MIRLNAEFLDGVGLTQLPVWEKNLLLKHLYETLERRVGIVLGDRMTNEQLDEFEALFEAKDEKGAFAWLNANFPDYKQIVQREFATLEGELIDAVPQILSHSRESDVRHDLPPETANRVEATLRTTTALTATVARSEGRRIRG